MTSTAGVTVPDAQRAPAGAVLTLALVGYFVTILDTSIVITGLPSIQRELGFSTAGLTWVQSAYLITFGGLLMLGARVGDLIGRRGVLIAGLAVFGVASLAIGLAQSEGLLLGARALQGVGAAMLTPSTLALITEQFDDGPARRRAIGWYAAMAGVGAALGLVVGGVLAETLSWRIGFLVNVPLTAALIVVAATQLPRGIRRRARFDVAGAALSIVGVGALAYAFVEAGERGWGNPATPVAAIVGALCIVALVLVERRVAAPLLPLHLFADRTRSGAYVIRGLFIAGFQTFFFFTSQYLQLGRGFTALEAGLGFLPMTVVNFATALLVGRVIARVGSRATLAIGLGLTAVGMIWLAQVEPGTSFVLGIALPMALIGGGQGFAFAPMTSFGIHGTRPDEAGAASGVLNVSHQLVGAIGLSLLTAIAATATASGAQGVSDRAGLALTGAAVCIAVTFVVALVVIPRERRR